MSTPASLGARLETVLSLLHAAGPFNCLADVGSDHAWIAVRALQNGDARSAVASDINPAPLARGRENAAHFLRAERMPRFVLSDGFDNLQAFDFDVACICGMGGELIADILTRYGAHESCRLLLQPMTRQEALRHFLWENGYRIHAEHFVCERGRPYVILEAQYVGGREEYTYAELFTGKADARRECARGAFAVYADKLRVQSNKRRQGLLARNEPTADEDALLEELGM